MARVLTRCARKNTKGSADGRYEPQAPKGTKSHRSLNLLVLQLRKAQRARHGVTDVRARGTDHGIRPTRRRLEIASDFREQIWGTG